MKIDLMKVITLDGYEYFFFRVRKVVFYSKVYEFTTEKLKNDRTVRFVTIDSVNFYYHPQGDLSKVAENEWELNVVNGYHPISLEEYDKIRHVMYKIESWLVVQGET